MGVQLREASFRDAGALSSLHAACFAKRWPPEDFEQFLANPAIRCVLAEAVAAKRTTAGFVLFSLAGGEAEIITICVKPAERKKGIARAMLEHIIAMAHMYEVGAIYLDVAEDNRAALKLYDSTGFVEVGRRADYYASHAGIGGAGKLALVLRLEIRPK